MAKYELLAPAGDMERLETALRFGADAVYLGGPKLQLRAGSVGFSMETLKKGIDYAHSLGRRVYVTVNAFANNQEAECVGEYAKELKAVGADAAIVADLGVLTAIRRAAPSLDVHISTQANCTNYMTARAYHDLGATRVVLAREMTLAEIAELRAKTPASLEIEAFVHGAMCMSYSGRCMISAHLTGRSANRGVCTQSCRWKYHLVEETRPGEFFPVEEDEKGMTILSSRDMNALPFLDQLMAAGVTSFKIEGRMKSPYYVATVTNAYRKRIDQILAGAETPSVEELQRELDAASHRPYSSGFYFGELKHMPSDDGAYLQDTNFVGVVKDVQDGRIAVEVRNRIFEGDRIEILSPKSLGESFIAREMTDNTGASVSNASRPSEIYTMACECPVEAGDLLRIRIQK